VHGVPVWVDVQEGRPVLNTAEGRAWPRNLERDPRVTLTVQNMENPYEYVAIRGHVAERTHEGADEHIDALAKKYRGQATFPGRRPGEQRLIIRVEPEYVRVRGG
jgi:PPOX class probable F420-dependent enzyme